MAVFDVLQYSTFILTRTYGIQTDWIYCHLFQLFSVTNPTKKPSSMERRNGWTINSSEDHQSYCTVPHTFVIIIFLGRKVCTVGRFLRTVRIVRYMMHICFADSAFSSSVSSKTGRAWWDGFCDATGVKDANFGVGRGLWDEHRPACADIFRTFPACLQRFCFAVWHVRLYSMDLA